MERKREYDCQKQRFKEEMSETEQLTYSYGLEEGYKVGYEEGYQARRSRQYWLEQEKKRENNEKKECCKANRMEHRNSIK